VKSIRLSLMVYFLALLAVTLGAVSLLAYRTAQQTLMDKKRATEDLIEAQFNERRRAEEDRLDQELLAQARTLAGLAIFELDLHKRWLLETEPDWQHLPNREASYLGVLTAALGSNGYLSAAVCIERGADAPLTLGPLTLCVSGIKFEKEDLDHHVDPKAAEYFQVHHTWGGTYRSESLGDRALPYIPGELDAEKTLAWKADISSLTDGTPVRRVTLQVSSPPRRNMVLVGPWRRWPPFGPPGPSAPPNGSGARNDPMPRSEPRRPDRPRGMRLDGICRPILNVQCAIEMARREAAVAGFSTQRDEELADLALRTDGSIRDLRTHLLTISLITFAATVLGGVWLVRVGLSPLRKLSVAVSRVSEKDFRLKFEQRRLPSELKPIAERLTETLDQLKRAFQREKQAAADISHELRTPLAALLTSIDVTLRKPRNLEEYREALQECRASGLQMNHLVERLLALARLDAGVDMLRPQSVDAAEIAEQCASMVRPLAEARGLDLRVHRQGPAVLQADPAKLREVVTNLLHNAIEYNKSHGSVDLSVARRNGNLEVEVKDTGIGMSTDARKHIFERFFRADPARSADGLHAGLGLAIVKGYVDLMGGSIAVESDEGQGSTFRVRLPAG
jgi:heavy metal sensor kinase